MPATFRVWVAKLAESSSTLNSLLQVDEYQSQLQASHLPYLWNVLITPALRPFHVQYPSGVPILG